MSRMPTGERERTGKRPGAFAAATLRHRPPYLWAAAATGLVWLLYAATLSPTTAFWDTSEYVATAHILGIPHPPGNPLFVVLARAWELLLDPTRLSVAVRINLFSATMSALAHGLWFLVAHRILTYFTDDRRFTLAGAFVAVLVSATALTVWNQSNVNEKVYTVSLFTIAALSWLAFHWRDNLGLGKDDNLLILMVFILALSVGNHLMVFLAAPALFAFILIVEPRTLLNPRLYLAAVVTVLLGLSIHLFLPIRAELNPVINEADPSCPSLFSALQSMVTYGQTGCAELSEALTRKQYDKAPLLPRLAPFHQQMLNYFQYFDWQWARSIMGKSTVFAPGRAPFTILFALLGLFGAIEHWRRDRVSAAYVAVLFATLSVALVFYLNFRYGYSLAPEIADRDLHEVRERDYFFIVGFSVWGLWAGIGIASLWRRLAEGVARSYRNAAPVLALALIPLALNWSWASRAGNYAARDWAYNLLMSVEPYGVLFTNGDNDTFPLWYLQEVEGIRRDVTVIVISYLNTEWYAKQLRDLTAPCAPGADPRRDPTRILCQRPYETEGVPAVYTYDPAPADTAGRATLLLQEPLRAPSRPILPFDDATIDRVAFGGLYPVREPMSYQAGAVMATISPGVILQPWHYFAIAIIRNSLGDRPIYFASTTNAYEPLGLEPQLLRQGLAFKLHNGSFYTVPPGAVRLPASPLTPIVGNWLDAERTEKLIWNVFVHRGGIPDRWSFWPDRPTQGIPNYYAWTHYALAQAALESGEQETANRNVERAEAWLRLGQ
ncbi:MAG: DUF2723 domain-containing protein [Gemmatimonadetes bacterium]|nr:DUF2723 domain-containing protein [Gemmatimonadota bacterium]